MRGGCRSWGCSEPSLNRIDRLSVAEETELLEVGIGEHAVRVETVVQRAEGVHFGKVVLRVGEAG